MFYTDATILSKEKKNGFVPSYGDPVEIKSFADELAGLKKVEPDDDKLAYMGRIDKENEKEPIFVFPCTQVVIRFKGHKLYAEMFNQHNCMSNFMGVIVDGKEIKVEMPKNEEVLVKLLDEKSINEHEVILFKRQDACHMITFKGFYLDRESEVLDKKIFPSRKIEVYGDSVSAGEVSEALEYAGLADPKHDGEMSDSWHSYSRLTAEKLNASLHDIAQGGIALLDKTGWFNGPDYKGIFTMYDRIEYNPFFKVSKEWNFTEYTPDIVIVAIGQNDANPDNYMAAEYNEARGIRWRAEYKRFIGLLREKYPKTAIILMTTILNHDEAWDNAIDDVYKELSEKDKDIYHFYFKKNGKGTHGHIRANEADEMANELTAFINEKKLFD